MTWDEERAQSLEAMWLWGIGSGTIAANLDVGRNAVMGRVNRTGLMGRKGERLGCVNPKVTFAPGALDQSVDELVGEGIGPDDPIRTIGRVAMTCSIAGHHAGEAARAGGLDPAQTERAIAALHDSGAWRRGHPPPAAWWHHRKGAFAFTLDMMAAAAMISIVGEDRRGERSYAPMEQHKHEDKP